MVMIPMDKANQKCSAPATQTEVEKGQRLNYVWVFGEWAMGREENK